MPPRRPVGQDFGDASLHGAAGEWRITGQHFVGHGSQRVDVRAGVDGAFSHGLFGRHVLGST